MPYLINAEENELKRLNTTTDEGVLGDEELLAAKGTRSSSVGYWEREWWDSDSNSFFKSFSCP
jgi:hypothetical protein